MPLLGAGHGIRAAAASGAVTPNTVLAWGDNALGEAGNGGSGDQHYCCELQVPYNDYPVAARGLTNAIAVSAGLGASAAIVQGYGADGSPDPKQNTVWTWGDDFYGELGARPPDICDVPAGSVAHVPCAKRPVPVRGPGGSGFLTGIVAIAVGSTHVLALRHDGTVWAWGNDAAGQLGEPPGSAPSSACPVTSTSGGSSYPSAPCEPYPIQVPGLTGVTTIAANMFYSLAIEHHGLAGPDDTVWAWGDNTVGELGQGWDCNGGGVAPSVQCIVPVPAPVPGIQGVTALAAGELGQIMAIVRGPAADGSDNQLWTWGGNNQWGESGTSVSGSSRNPATGYPVDIDRPQRVLDSSGTGYFTGAVAVATCWYASVALKYEPAPHTTTAWNWGLGAPAAASGTPGPQWLTPQKVRGADGAGYLTGGVAVASTAGSSHVLLADGTVWGWGGNDGGQLGAITYPASQSTFPVQTRGVAGATAIAGGYYHVLALAALPPPPPPVVPNPTSDTPPPLPFEQPATSPGQPLQTTASVPVVSTVVTPSTVNSPPPPTGLSAQPVSTPVQVTAPVHAPVQGPGVLAQGSQPVIGAGPVSGSTGALAPNAGDRPTPTDQLAMLRHEDAVDVAWAAAFGTAAGAAFVVGVVATARTRRPPTIRPAPAWAATQCPRLSEPPPAARSPGRRGPRRTRSSVAESDRLRAWGVRLRRR